LRVVNQSDESLGDVFVSPNAMRKLVHRGLTLSEGNLEVRGLRWEIEFRIDGDLLGRLRKEDFLAAVTIVPPG
jgi:hypothetical protein